ncbi:MAG: hypothetical protein ACI8W7_003973 [Gammaproteobacteria bacterium]
MSRSLINQTPKIINVGLADFARELAANGASVMHVDWNPPAGGDSRLTHLLQQLESLHGDKIVAANREAVRVMSAAEPVLVDVAPAAEVIPGLGEHVILHAGPPIEWARMCGPMRGAVCGVMVLEGWARDLVQAEQIVDAGEITFHPNHHFDAVGPMTGLTTMSQPVLVVENRTFGNRAFCTLNEGLGKVMRFGGNDDDVIQRLRWLRTTLAPLLSAALQESSGINLKNIIARGLSMGDEMHQRNVACTSLFIRELAPHLARAVDDPQAIAEALAFMGGNDQFFLNIAMVMGKSIMDPVQGIEYSTVVTAMSRNGTEFGIRMSATGERWFIAPVEMPQGLYFPGFTESDSNPDMGDSTIVETIGLGGFAMAASPAVAGFVGAGSAAEALDYTRNMYAITVDKSSAWTIPSLDFAGVPTAIDVMKVVETRTAPTINTGIAHREPGVGQVGAGVVRAPIDCFNQALAAFAQANQCGAGAHS